MTLNFGIFSSSRERPEPVEDNPVIIELSTLHLLTEDELTSKLAGASSVWVQYEQDANTLKRSANGLAGEFINNLTRLVKHLPKDLKKLSFRGVDFSVAVTSALQSIAQKFPSSIESLDLSEIGIYKFKGSVDELHEFDLFLRALPKDRLRSIYLAGNGFDQLPPEVVGTIVYRFNGVDHIDISSNGLGNGNWQDANIMEIFKYLASTKKKVVADFNTLAFRRDAKQCQKIIESLASCPEISLQQNGFSDLFENKEDEQKFISSLMDSGTFKIDLRKNKFKDELLVDLELTPEDDSDEEPESGAGEYRDNKPRFD